MLSRASQLALLAVLAGSLTMPALAEAGPDRHERSRMAEKLSDPLVQTQAAAMAAVMSQMVLDLKVGPMARAMGEWDRNARDIPPDARLGDLLGPDARSAPRDMAREVPRAMGKMGRTADAMEEMMPQIEAMAEKMRRALDQAGLGR